MSEEIDFDKLISLVHERVPLWNSLHNSFYITSVANRLWNEVAIKLNCSSQCAKRNWCHLKAKYRVMHNRKLKHAISNGSGNSLPPIDWIYYERLNFLDELYSCKTVIYSPSKIFRCDTPIDTNDPEITPSNTTELGCTKFYSDLEEISPENHTHTQLWQKPFKLDAEDTSSDNQNGDAMSLDGSHCEDLNNRTSTDADNEDTNADYYFLMSLLPYLHSIRESNKLSLRIRIQQIVLKAQQSSA